MIWCNILASDWQTFTLHKCNIFAPTLTPKQREYFLQQQQKKKTELEDNPCNFQYHHLNSFDWRVTVSGELLFLGSYGNCDVTNTVTLLF